LFHVEHSEGELWYYRWRIVGNYPPPYLVWREQTTDQKFIRIQAEIRGCEIEVEWRPAQDPADSSDLPDDTDSIPWLPVALLKLATPRAVFNILADQAFSPAEEFIVCAPVRDDGVAAYRFPAVAIEPGVEHRTYAQADAPAWANVLLAPGDFRPRVTGLTITNLAPSEDAWIEHEHTGLFRLSRCPLAAGRRWFAIGHDSASPGLVMASMSITPTSSSL